MMISVSKFSALTAFAAAAFAVPAWAATITSEDFEAGASGWSDNTTQDPGPNSGGLTRHLGQHARTAVVSKTFALSGTQTAVNIAFDFYRLDTWDGETFSATVFDAVGGVVAQLVTEPNWYFDGPANFAYNPNFTDRNTRLSFDFASTATSFTLAFSSGLDQTVGDEAWGVDNLVITDNSLVAPGVPEPSVWALLILGFGAVGAALRRRALSIAVA